MLNILAGLTWKICLVYLDDIIVFAKTFEEVNCQSPLPGKAKAVLGRSSGATEI
jgi:hypothetical protein